MAEEARLRQYLEKVTVDLRKAHRRVRDLEQSAREPIAIVGMSCRYPGGVDSPEALWWLLAAGEDGISEFPRDRGWDLERLYDPGSERTGTSYVREGGFVADAGGFDPGFFGIAPREALAMDPQQRLLLEACWEALERAGLDPQALRGEEAGVFAGAMYHDYGWGLQADSAGESGDAPTVGTGSAISGRVAYALGLEGPAITVDTACSSSLVALHLAARALRDGECPLALAGGVTVFSTPRGFIEFSRQGALAPDGRSKSFAESADGVAFAEGVGVLVLERLSDAERNGHPVLATVRGSAVNQDGASNGFTAPNGPSQERVIRQALLSAGLAPKDIDAVEAHGTGTTLGDPIEAGALLATYGQDRERPLRLGSIKSNIGHTQAAAGVAGVIKTVMAMREGVLPKTLHVDAPSSKVDWEAGEIELLTEAEPWEPNGGPRRAGVSSFGASGTNAHVILEEAPAVEAEDGDADPAAADDPEPPLPGQVPLALSAKSEPALRESAARLRAWLEADPGLCLTDVAHSLLSTRATLEHRAVVNGSERGQLLADLADLARGEESERIVAGRAKAAGEAAFLFPGQGSQWLGMGIALAEDSPLFARHLEECEAALAPHIDFSVREVLAGAEGAPSIERIEVVQPALFAVMVSLARLWRACGVTPAAVAGHSQGEIAAAHIAGGLSLSDAAMLAAARSRLISQLAGKGGMVSIAHPADALPALLGDWGERIAIAARNGPSSTIVSGDREALDRLLERCQEQGVRAREVPAAIASHSAHVEGLRDELLELLAAIAPRSGEIPFYSTVTGGVLDTRELGAEYWYRNLREPVRFEQVTRELLRHGRRALIEISPHPVFALALAGTVEDELADPAEATVLGTLRREEGDAERFTRSLARAHAAGAKIDWDAFFAGGAQRVPLPTYPFQRKRYWLSPAAGGPGDLAAAGQSSPDHPLLAAAVGLAGGEEWLLTGRISLLTHPWLADHAVAGTVLLPGTAFVELALRAGAEAGCEALEELTLEAPLVLAEEGAVQVQISVGTADAQGRREVAVHSRGEGEEGSAGPSEWTRNARGTLSPQLPATGPKAPESWPPAGAEPLETEGLYERLADLGFEYGPAFQGVTAAWRDGDDLFVELSLPEEQAGEAGRFGLHPALLDSAGHPGIDLALSADQEDAAGPMLPFAWRDVRLTTPGASSLRVQIGSDGLTAYDPSGAEVFAIGSVDVRPVDPAQLKAAARGRSLYRLEWVPAPPAGGPEPAEAEIADFRPAARGEGSLPGAAREETARALALLQERLGADQPSDTRLVFLTEGAVAAAEGEDPDLASAALCGLLRSAQSEHPGRFGLIDTDGTDASEKALSQALGQAEPQLALREGAILVPRLARAAATTESTSEPLDPDATVLITGGTSGMGALIARHLAEEHGARNLLLLSRRGPDTPGATELIAELQELGTSATALACDVSDRAQLKQAIDSIPQEHPLGAVIHSAAVLDDGVLEALDPDRLATVLAPKAEAAWHLHELTAEMELSQFVLFSSAAGLLGTPAQANYAAANAFLDALAAHRKARGLAGVALAWGGWDEGSEAISALSDSDRVRMGRRGFRPMSSEQVLELFDLACDGGEALMAPVELNSAALRVRAEEGTLPDVLRGIVRAPARRAAEPGSLAATLAALPEAERDAAVLELVREHAASVLGHESAQNIEPDRAFQELGFDSLAAVELRNRLGAATGLRLAPTLVFDYPSAAALAKFLRAEAGGEGSATAVAPRAAGSHDEPVAIVGMSCRFPGAVGSPEQLWRLVAEGREGIEALPADRGWDLERLYDPDPDRPGTSYARHGGFIEDAAGFDGAFFGISPREALAIDPQQRLLLEASWEALEDAGIDPGSLRGTPAGVFAGVMYSDYGDPVEGVAPGMSASAVAGRVAYAFGLEGPAMAVDTACSSSLVAMHLAAQALRGGECDLALAGGVTVLATPSPLVFFSRQRGLAPDGRCKSFAESADGIGMSEGTGMLALERLSDAERNGHPVLATIRGSAVNQDGASNGLTAPNGPSQERVIRQALANARLTPNDIDAVEAHGTGTALGDPIEAGALLATYGQERERPLKLGSIKSNIGHAQAAAGVAGVIKTVMAMREGILPKTLHVDAPSSKVDWGAGEIELLTEAEPWEANGNPRRAGVSSFGISGTNAHLILEEAPMPGAVPSDGGNEASDPVASAAPTALPGPVPLVLSAKSEPALRAQAARLATHLRQGSELDPVDVAYSLVTARAAFEQRAVVVGEETGQLLEALDSVAAGAPAPGAVLGRARAGRKLAYLFSGQGSQRAGMGRELYDAFPAYAEAFDRACELFDRELELSLKELVFGAHPEAGEALDDTAYAQPALFATEVALFRLLESRGLVPDLLCGHSIGEIAAAHVAGAFSLEQAVRLVGARGRLMSALPAGGAMVAVEATEAEVGESIAGRESEVAIAAINGPSSVVLSGVEEAVEEIAAGFAGQGRKTKRLAVSHAFHSPLIEPMLEDFAEVAAGIEYGQIEIPIVSNLSGELLAPERATDPAYWVAHVREPVRFMDGVRTLAAEGAAAYIELGPDPVLTAMASESLAAEEPEPVLAATLRQGRPEAETLVTALGTAHTAGAPLDWRSFFAGTGAKRVALPTYAFQRSRYWPTPTAGAGDLGAAGLGDADHPLLSAVVEDPTGAGLTFTGRVSAATHPWLADHTVAGATLFPGTALLELAFRAGEAAGAPNVEELILGAPLIVPEGGAVTLQVSVGEPDEQGRRELSIHSRAGEPEADAEWAANATGVLTPEPQAAAEPIGAWPPEGAEPLDVDDLYQRLADAGFEYGPAFQGLTAAWRAGEEIYAEVSSPEEHSAGGADYAMHPALLDAAHHAIAFAAGESGEEGLLLPFSWSDVSLTAAGARELRVALTTTEGGASLRIADGQGSPVAVIGGLALRKADLSQLGSQGKDSGLLAIEWRRLSPPADGPSAELRELDSGSAEGEADQAQAALRLVKQWLSEEEQGRLAILTRGAVAGSDGEPADPMAAAAWGLVRSAQSEHPGRFTLIDTDGSDASEAAIEALLGSEAEPQIVLRDGVAKVARAVRMPRAEEGDHFDPERTVLVTGATGALGALVARHLVEAHGVRHLLLVSRSGSDADGAEELRAELEQLGAKVEIAACDVSDRGRLESLLAAIPADHPLGAVIHAAGVLDDATVEAIEPEQIERVFAPKAVAARHLHELTADLDLTAFVMFSSVAAPFGSPGQGAYAAANAYLDALAQRRRAAGLPGVSIAWGMWERESAMTARMGDAGVARLRRAGIEAMDDERGLTLFDRALDSSDPAAVALLLQPAALRSQAEAGLLPPILSDLVPSSARRRPRSEGPSLASRLEGVPEAERDAVVLDLVLAEVALVLGHSGAEAIEPDSSFKDLGFDSLAAVELRNRLNSVTGLRLAPAIVFDYPTPATLAEHLLAATAAGGEAALEQELEQLTRALTGVADDDPNRSRIASQLRALAADLEERGEGESAAFDPSGLEAASDEELMEFIDAQVEGDGASGGREAKPAGGERNGR